MGLPIPNLDNRTFEQLLQEARKSISNYSSQWTNHNPADPGITLIELFAWLAEITNYRINLVTEEHLLKYLKLLGVRPHGFLPATVDLSFETEEIRYLEKGTVFLAEKAGEIIDFELLEDITVIPAQLEKIIEDERSVPLSPASSSNYSQSQRLSRGIFDRSFANKKEDLFFAPFGLDTKKNSVLYLGFIFKSQKVTEKEYETLQRPKSLNFMCYLYEKGFIKPGKHGDEAEYNYKNAKLKWEISVISISPDKEKWREVFPDDNTQNFMKSGSILFTDLEDWACSTIDTLTEGEYFWLRCILLESEYEYPPQIEKISLNTISVIQKKRVQDRESWGNNGLPGQIFKLTEGLVLRKSLKLALAGEWKEVADFNSSGPESTHFTLDILKGEIRFGDGKRGKIPRKGSEIIALEYKTAKGEKITDRILGVSIGVSKFFTLPEIPVLKGSLKLALTGEWNEVEDFDSSGPDSTHFTLESLKGEIRFGDGLRGKVPREGTKIQIVEYETTRGEKGNLPADSIWTMKEKTLKELKISNYKPAVGGKDEESINEAFERFNRDLRVPYRAVTSEDYEYIAKETPGLRVAQAKAIPNFDPYSQVDREGSVTVVIIPFSPLDTFKEPPKPSLGFRTEVARHLEKHRLLGTRIYVVSPEYVQVKVNVHLGGSKMFIKDEIKKKVINKLKLFLHPTKGGISGKGWPIGEPVYCSELIKQIMGIEGVEFVDKTNIYAQEGAHLDENGNLQLDSKIATVYSGEHSVEVF